MNRIDALEGEIQAAWDEVASRAEAWADYWGERKGEIYAQECLLRAVRQMQEKRRALAAGRQRLAGASRRRKGGAR